MAAWLCWCAVAHIFLGRIESIPFWMSYTTVDGWNPANQLRLVVYPIIYEVLYIPGGATSLCAIMFIHVKTTLHILIQYICSCIYTQSFSCRSAHLLRRASSRFQVYSARSEGCISENFSHSNGSNCFFQITSVYIWLADKQNTVCCS